VFVTEAADIVRISPVIPVVVLDDVDAAVPLAQALLAGGIGVIEITMRTAAALAAMRVIAAEVPGITVGAGTVLDARQAARAVDAGARFLVSPGAAPMLLDGLLDTGLPLLPGVATVSEALALRERGIRIAKFFPAGPAGGPAYLRALVSPLPDLLLCPTGGIDAASAPDYLGVPNVICVGGSWLTPSHLLAAGDWDAVTALAAAASGLRAAGRERLDTGDGA
jgi:2-dehydro-3-deoxyphosphogluconate aldolase/(4S)-4-hydroxy-2-oxoglutarate aldolase